MALWTLVMGCAGSTDAPSSSLGTASLGASTDPSVVITPLEFGGAVAKISLPLVTSTQSTDTLAPISIPAPDWRPQNG